MSLRALLKNVISAHQTDAIPDRKFTDKLRSKLITEISENLEDIDHVFNVSSHYTSSHRSQIRCITISEHDDIPIYDKITVIYLFSWEYNKITLSINQGSLFQKGRSVMEAALLQSSKARISRQLIKDWMTRFPLNSISEDGLTEKKEVHHAGHIIGLTYNADSLPSDLDLANDLRDIIKAYRALILRLKTSTDPGDAELSENENSTIIEKRQHAQHLRIERNPEASNLAKAFHGTKCQACGMDFSLRYGPMGAGYIEAHHLRPISSLNEGQALEYEIAKDFAVLCANCHRMIHRMKDPSDLKGLRKIIRSQRELIRQQKDE